MHEYKQEEEDITFCLVGFGGGVESALLLSAFVSSGSASCHVLSSIAEFSGCSFHL